MIYLPKFTYFALKVFVEPLLCAKVCVHVQGVRGDFWSPGWNGCPEMLVVSVLAAGRAEPLLQVSLCNANMSLEPHQLNP